MSQSYQGWIVVAVVAVLGLLYVWFSSPEPPATPPQQLEKIAPKPTTRTSVAASMERCTRQGDTVEMSGSVKNTGTTRVSRVVVETLWKDEFGLVVERGSVFAVGEDSPLAPGMSRNFTDTTRHRRVTRCNVEVADYWADEPRP